jgi:hypothetical protein
MAVEDRIEQVHPIAILGIAVVKPIEKLAAHVPYGTRDEVEEILALVIDGVEGAIIGQPRDIDALGQASLVGLELFELRFAHGDGRSKPPMPTVVALTSVPIEAGLSLGLLLVKLGEMALGARDLLRKPFDLGIGDVLFVALGQAETRMVMIGITPP